MNTKKWKGTTPQLPLIELFALSISLEELEKARIEVDSST